jgi:shikimate kinase
MKGVSRCYLVGMMGSGKSAVGRELAQRMGWAFIDTDDLVEAMTGFRVAALFAKLGEEGFRAEEARALRLAAARRDVVVATGGGMVLKEANRVLRHKTGWVVYLEADPAVLAQRVAHGGPKRPLLDGKDSIKALRDILKLRQPFYLEAAHVSLPTSGSIRQVAEAVLTAMPGQ